MRRLIGAALLLALLSTGAGCFMPAYSGDPAHRTEQLIFTSEDLRAMILQWERFWFRDMPDHMAVQRVHGGVL